VSFTPRPLYPRGNSPRYPLDSQGGPQNRCGCGGGEENSQRAHNLVLCNWITLLLHSVWVHCNTALRSMLRWSSLIKMQITAFWVVTPCSDVSYQRFEGLCCLHLHNTSLHSIVTLKTTTWIFTTVKISRLKQETRWCLPLSSTLGR